MFTVFAPVNEHFSEAEAEELIAEYESLKKQGIREEDNRVVGQFVQNHIALFNRSVSSLTNDSITLMNGKYETLTAKKFGERSILTSNQYVGNGVLFTIEAPCTFLNDVSSDYRQASSVFNSDFSKNFSVKFNTSLL